MKKEVRINSGGGRRVLKLVSENDEGCRLR